MIFDTFADAPSSLDLCTAVRGTGIASRNRAPNGTLSGLSEIEYVHSSVMGPLPFDPEKATEALIYVSRRVPGADLYKTLEILYLADKSHLHRYGRFIFGDRHAALPHGPVPQGAYDILRDILGEPGRYFAPARESIRIHGTALETVRDAEVDVFSTSDLECLDEAVAIASRLTFQQLKDLTHDAAFKATRACGEIDIAAIAALAHEPAPLIQHLADPHPDRE